MAVRIAKSLATVRTEANELAPNRSKASDGWIGNPDHAARPSRHNPNDAGIVCALDLTDDPADGLPIHVIMRWLATNVLRPLFVAGRRQGQASTPAPWRDLAYFISADQTAGWSTGWLWVAYNGSNPHRKHGHGGVGIGPESEPRPPYDSIVAWGIARAVATQPPTPAPGDDMYDAQAEARLNAKIEALTAQVAALARAVASNAAHGAFDYEPAGGDTNSLMLELDMSAGDGSAAVVQRFYADGWGDPRVLGRGFVAGAFSGPLVRGRRLDYFAQKVGGAVVCFTFDPDFPAGPLPGGWSATDLPAV